MKQMKPVSARALTWLAAILIIIGGMILSPSGAFFLFLVAALVVVAPAIFGTGRIRVAATVLLLVSICLAVNIYPDFKSDQERYRNHMKKSALGTYHRGTEKYGACLGV
jgi:membrane protein implicated in regulation of membrane protease activity